MGFRISALKAVETRLTGPGVGSHGPELLIGGYLTYILS